MSRQFRAGFYSAHHPSDPATAKALATLLGEKHVAAQKCDTVERAKKPFSAAALAECYSDEGTAFVTGSEAGFSAYFKRWPNLSVWRFFFDVDDDDPAPWCAWMERVAEKLPPYFGYLCPDDEFDAKHQSLPGRKGISVAEFKEYLPGLYWMTVFGKELSAGIGKKGFNQLLDCEVTSLKGGLTSVRFSGPAVLADYQPRIATLQKQAARLKPNLFFDPKKASGYQQIPELVAALGG